jgi:hypothetical protein
MPAIDVLKHDDASPARARGHAAMWIEIFGRLKTWAVGFVSRDRAMQMTRTPETQPAWFRERLEIVSSNKVVRFPRSDQASLRRLRADMRARFASLGVGDFSPFIFEIDAALPSRLWIDPVTYVDVMKSQSGFRIVIDDEMFGYMAFETDDFESILTLVCHYVLACLTARLRGGDAE